MRKFLIPLLAASALVPAAASAQDRDFGRGDRDRSDRSERSKSDDRPQRAERPARSERADRPVRVERTERIERADRQPRVERRIDRDEPARRAERVRRIERNDDSLLGGLRATARRQADRDAVETRRDRDGRRDRLVVDGSRVDRDRDGRRDWRRDRDGDSRRDWRRDRDHDRRWSRDWRRDNRYNWHSYRNRYGSLFRLGRYYDPYGYRYRRFSIGLSLWPNYYRSRYWLSDPWHYRLPPAYGPYRWVRYYDDALLVNIYTGHVVDVIYNVFW